MDFKVTTIIIHQNYSPRQSPPSKLQRALLLIASHILSPIQLVRSHEIGQESVLVLVTFEMTFCSN